MDSITNIDRDLVGVARGALPTTPRSTHRLLRIAMAAVMAVGVFVSTTTEAHAANSWAAVPSPHYTWSWGDCFVRLGIARDPHAAHAFPNYHIVGGLHVWCTGYHYSLKATVGLNYWEVGTRERAVEGVAVTTPTTYRASGFNSGIVISKDACNSGKPTYWRPVATVSIHGLGTLTFSGYSYRHDTKCH